MMHPVYWRTLTILLLGVSIFSGCGKFLSDSDRSETEVHWYPNPSDPSSLDTSQRDREKNCNKGNCREIEVFVHYMLAETFNENVDTKVEVFDNEFFHGYPINVTKIPNMVAKKGEWQKATLLLEPGSYYMRAVTSNRFSEIRPKELIDMDSIKKNDVGLIGGLSSAYPITVAALNEVQNIAMPHLFIDQLFKKSGSAPDKNAKLRIKLKVIDPKLVQANQTALIQLRDSDDIAIAPIYSFSLPTEALLVDGHHGEAEFVTPTLEEGKYTIFVFIDRNGNGYVDDDELQNFFLENGAIKAVNIHENSMPTIKIELNSPKA